MNWRYYAAISLLLSAATARPARSDEIAKSPAFTTVAELSSGFHSLYTQNFMEAREKFDGWEAQHPEEPFGQVAIAASYLFEELYRQGVLSSDFFLNEKRFLHGIEGKPDAARMKSFQEALDPARNKRQGFRSFFCADNDGGNGIECRHDAEEAAYGKLETVEGRKRIRQAIAYAAARRKRRLCRPRNCQLHHRKPFRRRAVLSHVWRSPRRQKAGDAAAGKNYRWRKVFATIRQDFAGIGGSPGKAKPTGTETVSRIERGISREPTLRR